MWVDDLQHGIGLEITHDECFYSGEYFKGKKEGIGNILNI